MLRTGEFLPGIDQALVDRIELVGALRDDVALDRLFEPGPLKDRRFENRGRRIRVVLQQFRRAPAVIAEVEAAVEAGIVAVPALGQQRPERFGYLQPAQIFFIADRAADQFEAHRVDLAGGRLDPPFDLVQREGVIGAFVPIAFAVQGVKIEADELRGRTPVVAFGADDALHGRQPPLEKCEPNECANAPKPPRATACEPESLVPDDEWLDEESLL